MTLILQAVNAALIDFVWQGLAVAFLLAMLLVLLRKRSANLRYVVSCVALAVLAVAPILTAILYWRRHAVAAAVGAQSDALPQLTTVILAVSGPAATNWLRAWATWMLPVWAAGVLALSIRMVWSCRQVTRLRRSGEPAAGDVVALVARLAERIRDERERRRKTDRLRHVRASSQK
jgi:hypothetical protein